MFVSYSAGGQQNPEAQGGAAGGAGQRPAKDQSSRRKDEAKQAAKKPKENALSQFDLNNYASEWTSYKSLHIFLHGFLLKWVSNGTPGDGSLLFCYGFGGLDYTARIAKPLGTHQVNAIMKLSAASKNEGYSPGHANALKH